MSPAKNGRLPYRRGGIGLALATTIGCAVYDPSLLQPTSDIDAGASATTAGGAGGAASSAATQSSSGPTTSTTSAGGASASGSGGAGTSGATAGNGGSGPSSTTAGSGGTGTGGTTSTGGSAAGTGGSTSTTTSTATGGGSAGTGGAGGGSGGSTNDGGTCTNESDATFCARLGKNCGTVAANDNCGVSRTVASCGSCTSPQTCGGGGVNNVCACPSESNAAFCSRLIKNCGNVTALDNCGKNRTASCGSCTSPDVCGGTGTANVCATPAYLFTTGILTTTSAGTAPTDFAKAFDENVNTKWLSPGASAPWIALAFQNNARHVAVSYAVGSANDPAVHDPKSWKLDATNDDTNWATLDTETNQTFSARQQLKTYTLSNTTAYNRYRLTITANNGDSNIEVSEFQAFGY